MPRPKNPLPKLNHFKTKDTARVWFGGRWVHLGKWGSPEAHEAYQRLLAELTTAPAGLDAGAAAAAVRSSGISVAEVVLGFTKGPAARYKRSRADNFKTAVRPLVKLYAATPAAGFGPKALKAVRGHMVGMGWGRAHVNKSVATLKAVFRWAASEELIPAAVFHALETVKPLEAGETAAPEPTDVTPVKDELIDATLPHLPKPVQGLVRFQRHTGCRPGEAVRVRWRDIDTDPGIQDAPGVWQWTLAEHKTKYRGKRRVVFVGPKGQAVLNEFRNPDPDAYIFCPAAATAEMRAKRKAARKTPVYSAVKRPKADPRVKPGACYTTGTYGQAVARACEKAGVERWGVNRLRHNKGTEVRAAFGLEAVQVTLGHANAKVSEVYAERDEALAARVALASG